VLFLNRTLSRELSAVLGKPMDDFIAEPHRQAVIDCVEAAFDSGESRELEYTVVMGDGTRRHQHTRIVPFRGPKREALALMLTDDITDRRNLTAELEHSLEFRRRVVEHLPDYVVMIDREHRFVWANRVSPHLTLHEVLGKKIEDYSDLPVHASAAIAAAFESATPGQYEGEHSRDGQSKAWYQVRVAPIVLGTKVEHVLLITSDITQRKHAEQALRRTEEQLHQAQRLESLGQLAGGVAHDFNNLLQVIQSNLYFVQHSLDKGQSATNELEQAQRATERAAELTSHLLAIGRRKRVDSRRLELGTLVAQSVRMLRRAIPENIGIRYDGPAEQQFVELDAPQFEQVLINLCVNARDAMPDGGALSIGIEPDGDTHVVLNVTDTGSGIAPENLSRVFEPFFTTKGTGSGLGLAVAAGIVGAHGGVITAESDGRTGTTMKIRLPRVASQAAQPAAPPLRAVSGSGLILLAEDEELLRSQLVRLLESAGYRVIQAHNGVAAVEAFRARRGAVDLVILDVVMPELDGWQAFLRIAELEPRVKVLFTTGYAASVLPEDFAARGARFLSKPYKPQALLANVHELLAANSRPTDAG
jgi:PAS domain S-box-containing protein